MTNLPWKGAAIAQTKLTRFAANSAGCLFSKRELDVGGDAGDFFADHQFVNVVGAFVGENAFEIVHVAHDAVVVHDAVGAENVARFAGDLQSDGDVVHFQHGNVRRIDFPVVFYS